VANVAPPIDPSQYPDYIDLERKQQLAQALMGAFQQTNQTPQSWDSMRVTPKRGALQNVSALATALMAGRAQGDAQSAAKGLAQGQAAQFNAMFPGSTPPPTGQPVDPKVAQLTQAISGAQQSAPGIALPGAPPPQASGQAQAGGVSPGPQAPSGAPSTIPSLTGDPTRDRLFAVQMGVPKYLDALATRYQWTDAQKNDAYRGISANQSRTMAMADSLKGAVVPGSSSTLGLDASGNVQAAPVGGLAPNMAQLSAATTAATQSQMPHEVKDAQGRSIFTYTTPPALAGGRGGIPTGTEGGGGQTTAGAAFQGAQGKAATEYSTQVNADAENALQGKRTLSEMGNLLQGFTPGAGAPVLQALGSVAQAMGVPEDKVTSLTGMNVGDTQAFQKGTANLAAEAAKQMTNKVTQQEFKVYLANNPNWMMTPTGIKKAMDFMGKGFDQTLDKQQSFQAFTANPKNDPGRYAIDFPAYYNQQTREKIASGALNSSPASRIPIATAGDIANPATKAPVMAPGATKIINGRTYINVTGLPDGWHQQ
jgi:hypothetical protein